MTLTSLALLLTGPASADAGLRVLVQPWTPANDDDYPRKVLDDPNVLSKALHDHWADWAPAVHERLLTLLGAGDLTMVEPIATIEPVTDGHTRLIESLSDLKFVTSTCELDLDLTVTVPLTVGSDLRHPLAFAASSDALGKISNLRTTSKGDCDALAAGLAADLRMHSLDEPLASHAAAALDDLGATLVDYGAANLVVVGAWGGGEQPLTLAFGAGPMKDDGRRSAFMGTLRSATGDGPLNRAVSCADIALSAARKAGPRPILDADGHLGNAPLEPIDAQLTCGAPDENGIVRYTISGVSASFPTVLKLGSVEDCDASATPDAGRSAIQVHGLDSVVLPGDLFQQHALVASEYLEPCRPTAAPPPSPAVADSRSP